MTTFVDSSAIVTRYVSEPLTVVFVGDHYVVSAISHVEVPSALWRRARMAEISAQHAARKSQEFELDCVGAVDEPPLFTSVAVNHAVLGTARQLTTRGLRSLDAIQLATAMVVRDADPECDTVAALDRRLRDAAAAEGFRLLPSG